MKIKAHTLVNLELKKGGLIKPEACEDCGVKDVKLIGHHNNYDKPLEVEWLCSSCHGKRHAGEYRRPIEIGPMPEDFDNFIKDPEGFTKDLLYLTIRNIDNKDLIPLCDKLKLSLNALRHLSYREKSNQHLYLWRAIYLSVATNKPLMLEVWASFFKQEMHPRGTGAELERLRQQEQKMKKVLGVED